MFCGVAGVKRVKSRPAAENSVAQFTGAATGDRQGWMHFEFEDSAVSIKKRDDPAWFGSFQHSGLERVHRDPSAVMLVILEIANGRPVARQDFRPACSGIAIKILYGSLIATANLYSPIEVLRRSRSLSRIVGHDLRAHRAYGQPCARAKKDCVSEIHNPKSSERTVHEKQKTAVLELMRAFSGDAAIISGDGVSPAASAAAIGWRREGPWRRRGRRTVCAWDRFQGTAESGDRSQDRRLGPGPTGWTCLAPRLPVNIL